MELQFSQSVLHCFRQCAREYQVQEQTQEIRIPDGMPDIGVVLACWGQVILHGKEWRSEHTGINGGVMAKVLYMPEEGEQPQSVEVWLPFQMKWQIPGDCQDGFVMVVPSVRSTDARALSARKLMVRTNIGVQMDAVCPCTHSVAMPENLPEDVQVLTKRHTVTILKETGEKILGMEETLELSGRDGQADQLIYFSLSPQVLEQKVLSDKLVFRGLCNVHLLYRTPEGQLQSRDFDIPFSQYAELEQEHSPEANPVVVPVITAVESEITPEGHVRIKASLSGQYKIYDQAELEVAEDAYSPVRKLELVGQPLAVPYVAEQASHMLTVQADPQVDVMRPVDLAFSLDQPYLNWEDHGVDADISGAFQLLYYDPEGQLQCAHIHWEERQNFPAKADEQLLLTLIPGGRPQYNAGMLHGDILADTTLISVTGGHMLTGMQMGETTTLDPDRPSMVIMRAGSMSLWDLAKENGSTPDQIRQANALQAEPTPEQVLLIPII